MRTPTTRTVRSSIAGGAVVLLAVTGCGSDDSKAKGSGESSGSGSTASEEATGSASSAASFDKATATTALLTEAELPGYTATPQEQIAAALQQAANSSVPAAIDNIDLQPAECKEAVVAVTDSATTYLKNPDGVAMAMLVNSSDASAVTEMIAPESSSVSIDDTAELVKKCGTMTMSIQGTTMNMTMTPVQIDVGDSSLGVLTTINSPNGSYTSGAAYISGNGSTLTASQSGGVVDETALKDLATKAYTKAKPVLG